MDEDRGAVGQFHPDTSHEAADAIAPSIHKLQKKVLDILKLYPMGLTDEQMQRILSMNPSTQRPRRGELVKAGLVEETRYRRKTLSGRKAIIWRIAV